MNVLLDMGTNIATSPYTMSEPGADTDLSLMATVWPHLVPRWGLTNTHSPNELLACRCGLASKPNTSALPSKVITSPYSEKPTGFTPQDTPSLPNIVGVTHDASANTRTPNRGYYARAGR